MVVVSEENGAIRLAENGRLSDPVAQAEFAEQLRRRLSRPKRRGQGTMLGAIFGTVGGVDAPALPTPGLGETPGATETSTPETSHERAVGEPAHDMHSDEGDAEARRTA